MRPFMKNTGNFAPIACFHLLTQSQIFASQPFILSFQAFAFGFSSFPFAAAKTRGDVHKKAGDKNTNGEGRQKG